MSSVWTNVDNVRQQ